MAAVTVKAAEVQLRSQEWQVELHRKYPLQCPRPCSQGEMTVPMMQAHLLTGALQLLGALSKPLSIVYETGLYGAATGRDHMLTSLGINFFDLTHAPGKLHPTMLLEAISIARISLESLTLGGHSWTSGFIPRQVFDIWMVNFAQASSCWSTMTSLTLTLERPEDGWTAHNAAGLCRFLAGCLRLESLIIMLDFEDGRDASAQGLMSLIAASVTSKVLRDVKIFGFQATADDIIAFLLRHRKSLRRLSFRASTLPTNATWTPVLQTILHELELEYLELGHLEAESGCLTFGKGDDDMVSNR
jgi:hypothetical protein